MKKRGGKILKIMVPVACSVLLIWWLFRKVDFQEMTQVLKHNTNYWVFLPVMVIVVLSHVIRGIRWGYQLRAAGCGDVPRMTLCCSIFGAYALNLVIPFAGEGWRIVYIARRQNAPVATVLGTDLGDRISDAVVVIVLLLLALVVGEDYIEDFMSHYAVGNRVLSILEDGDFWMLLVGSLLALVCIGWALRNFAFMRKLRKSASSVWHGFWVLFTMPGRGMYLLLTIGIWLCYYLETYVSFWAFPFTRQLAENPSLAYGLLPGLISFVLSSLSMAIPSNGGLGPWNLAVVFALSMFGISSGEGAAFSIAVWSAVTITLILLGLFTIGYVSRNRRRERRSATALAEATASD